jgi:hypothetical protein
MRQLSLLLAATFLLASGSARSDDKEKADKLRKEIAELRKQLSEKEAELAKLDPVKMVDYLWTNKMEPGDVGPFGSTFSVPETVKTGQRTSRTYTTSARLRVVKVLDKESMIIAVLSDGGIPDKVRVLVTNFDTTGIADGRILTATREKPSPVFRVLGTKKIEETTYAHVELWTLPYKPPKK